MAKNLEIQALKRDTVSTVTFGITGETARLLAHDIRQRYGADLVDPKTTVTRSVARLLLALDVIVAHETR